MASRVAASLPAARRVARDGDAEAGEEFALGDEGPGHGAGVDRGAGKRGEIDMGGEVGLAGFGERVGIGVAAHRLQRVAEGGTLVAVVDDQRRTAVDGDACGQGRHDGGGGGGDFEDVGLLVARHPWRRDSRGLHPDVVPARGRWIPACG